MPRRIHNGKGPLSSDAWKPLAENPLAYAGLATSLTDEHDYAPELEGKIPEGLRGSLYRNGPGLYDRGPHRKRMLLDGDGMVQAFHFTADGARYVNRFVRTPKLVREEAAGRFLDATWSTLAPGAPWKSWGGKIPNQAGTTVVRRGERIFAFDEGHPPFELAPVTLETKGEAVLDGKHPSAGYNAHWKIDGATGEWLTLSIDYGRVTKARVTGHSHSGDITTRLGFVLPRNVYMHDWFITEHWLGFVMHPAYVSFGGMLKVMAGLQTYSEIIEWRPRMGNRVLLVPRFPQGEPRIFEAEACWMWHSLNAFERDGAVVLDFVGSAIGGGLGSDDSPLFTVMRGLDPPITAKPESWVRRYTLSLRDGRNTEETIASDYNYEMPVVQPELVGRPHRYGYFCRADTGALFWSTICRIDMHGGAAESFRFGDGVYCTEPIFAPAGPDRGWLLVECYDGNTKKSFLAVMDAGHVADGPLAVLRLTHHVPFSFHGYWYQAGIVK